VGAGDSVDEVLGTGLAVVVVDQQRHPGDAVGDALERGTDPVVALIAALAHLGRRQDLTERVEDHQRRWFLVPADRRGDGVDDAARLDPGLVLELGRDRVAGQQPPAVGL
jgi:hypothetical protein